jgi:uncharacterized protein YjiS (DUF1127 family)
MTAHSVSAREASSRENVLIKKRLAVLPLGRLIAMLAQWRERAQARRELAALSLFDLKDIGYPAQLEAEKAKPFWRA